MFSTPRVSRGRFSASRSSCTRVFGSTDLSGVDRGSTTLCRGANHAILSLNQSSPQRRGGRGVAKIRFSEIRNFSLRTLCLYGNKFSNSLFFVQRARTCRLTFLAFQHFITIVRRAWFVTVRLWPRLRKSASRERSSTPDSPPVRFATVSKRAESHCPTSNIS